MIADFDTAGGLQYVTDDAWIPELGIRYKLGIDGLNLWLILLTTRDRVRLRDVAVRAAAGRARRAVRVPLRRSARPPCSARSWPRTWRCSSSSST